MFQLFLIYGVIAGGATLFAMSRIDARKANIGDMLCCLILGQAWPCMIVAGVLSVIF